MIATASIPAVLAESVGAISGGSHSDLIAALMILVVGIALGIGLTCLLLVAHFLRRGRLAAHRLPRRPELVQRDRRAVGPVFSAPPRWLAIRSGNVGMVQAALGLENPTACSWEEGLTAAHDKKLFISPPVHGWILVMGSNLPEATEDVDQCFHFLLDLSRKLGVVHFFSVNRAVNHHAWVQLEQGAVQRAYAWAGRVLWNQGKLTHAEIDLGLKCFSYGEGEDRADYGRVDPAAVNTERVPLLAARWSLDPATVDTRQFRENPGITGQPSRSKAH